ncbi:MAG TPA: hypothetical protein VGN97_15845 [Mesorhizobium sp.]|nr:hypothetical protein [Mesorhizobium sp.]
MRAIRWAAMAVLALAAVGCARQPEPTPLQAGAINTGTYPNLNITPPVAAPQLSAQDQAAQRAELNGARARQAAAAPGGGASAAEQERLRRLAQTHEQNTLSAIEGQP